MAADESIKQFRSFKYKRFFRYDYQRPVFKGA
jgi:hypothetical protein